MEEFAESIGIWKQTVIDWVKVYPEFHAAYVRAKQLFRDFIVKNGITNRYDSRFAMFVAINDTDMRNITEVSVRGEIEHHADPEEVKLLREVSKGFIEQKRQAIGQNVEAKPIKGLLADKL